MTFAQRRNRLTTHYSEIIPVVKRRISIYIKEIGICLKCLYTFKRVLIVLLAVYINVLIFEIHGVYLHTHRVTMQLLTCS